MNVELFRKIDIYAGIPLCWFFTGLNRFKRVLMPRKARVSRKSANKYANKSDNNKGILIIKPSEQGATVIAGPAIAYLAEKAGPENIYFLTFSNNSEILSLLNLIPDKNIITIETSSLFLFFLTLFKALVKIWKLNISAAIDFEYFSRFSALIAWLSRARIRIGYHSFSNEGGYRGDLFTHRLNYVAKGHQSRIYMDLVQAINLSSKGLPARSVKIEPRDSLKFILDQDTVNNLLKKLHKIGVTGLNHGLNHGPNQKKNILINTNSGDLVPLRKWPEERYVQVVKMLLLKYEKINIFFTGDHNEQARVEKIVSGLFSDRCYSLAGKLNLKEFITLIAKSDLLITNDSGPGHFCALTDTPSIVLFGPETPEKFCPLSRNTHTLWLDLPCSPCVNAFNNRKSPCCNNLCMQGIKAESVFDLAIKILKNSSNLKQQ